MENADIQNLGKTTVVTQNILLAVNFLFFFSQQLYKLDWSSL